MVKVMYEGTVAKALKSAEAGLTTGGAVIYEVMDVPASVTFEDVAAAIRAVKNQPPHRNHEVRWNDLVTAATV
jgi:phosphohistidine swiveling domain-containing protein